MDLGKETNLESNDLQENENENENENNIENEYKSQQYDNNNEQISLDVQELEDKTELKELDWNISLENDLETNEIEPIKLKKPNEVYYELYKEARQKAKLAKKSAIIAYLEAKNIRQTYMLDNLDESESDIDAEIDEVSESELEGL